MEKKIERVKDYAFKLQTYIEPLPSAKELFGDVKDEILRGHLWRRSCHERHLQFLRDFDAGSGFDALEGLRAENIKIKEIEEKEVKN